MVALSRILPGRINLSFTFPQHRKDQRDDVIPADILFESVRGNDERWLSLGDRRLGQIEISILKHLIGKSYSNGHSRSRNRSY